MAKCVVGEGARPALAVVDHGNLEQGSVRQDGLCDLADECDVAYHLRGDPPADVADDDRIAEAEAEKVRGIDAWIEAGDDEEVQLGENDGAFVPADSGKPAVACERSVDGVHSGQLRAGTVASGPTACGPGASSTLATGCAGSNRRAISAPATATPAATKSPV